MESGTINTRTLAIDGMSGEECVQKVTGALKGVHGVSTQSVKVGSATIGADQTACNAACAAIGTAGYTAREGASSSSPSTGVPWVSSAKSSGQVSGGPAAVPVPAPSSDRPAAGNPAAVKAGVRSTATAQAAPVKVAT